MAKNRGESLLVKLKKYPYDKKQNMNSDKQWLLLYISHKIKAIKV